MNVRIFFESLNENEKQELLTLAYQHGSVRKKQERYIKIKNNEVLNEWSNGLISDRLKNAILLNNRDYELSSDYLNELDKSDIKSMRNIGLKTLKEFLKLQELNNE